MHVTIESRTFRQIPNIIIFSIGIILVCSAVASCADKTDKDGGEGNKMPTRTIEEVLKAHTNRLMSLPGVVGTAQSLCDGQPCIKVYVGKKTSELERRIPKTLEGFPVVIQETGKFKALPDS